MEKKSLIFFRFMLISVPFLCYIKTSLDAFIECACYNWTVHQNHCLVTNRIAQDTFNNLVQHSCGNLAMTWILFVVTSLHFTSLINTQSLNSIFDLFAISKFKNAFAEVMAHTVDGFIERASIWA